jgi:hemolysin activation/secretion protein
MLKHSPRVKTMQHNNLKNTAVRIKIITTGVIAICAFFSQLASAVTDPPRGDADTSRLRVAPLPLPGLPNFDLKIETPEKAPVSKAVDEIEFTIKEIKVEGVTQYPPEQIKKIFAPLEGKRVSLEALRKAADQLESRYRADGFFLVRVFVPPQQVKDGLFSLRVVEGYIEAAFTEGGTDATQQLVERLLAPVIGKKPIDLQSLEQALLILNDIPGVRVAGLLRQGSALGASELVVSLVDPPKVSSLFSMNNSLSRVLGEWNTNLNVNISNPLPTRPGVLSLGLSTSALNDYLRAVTVRYSTFVGDQGMVVSMGGLAASAKLGASLVGIESNSYSLGPRVRYPLKRSRGVSLFIDSGLTLNHSRTTSEGLEIIADSSTVADVSLAAVDLGRFNGNTEATVGISQGLDALGSISTNAAAPSVSGFSQRFTKLKYSASRLQGLPQDFSLQFNFLGQWSSDTLLSGEQVLFGGSTLGRAYDSGAVAGDSGFGLLMELRKDMPAEKFIPRLANGKIQFFVFTDYAEARLNLNPNRPETTASLRSHGAGLRYRDMTGLMVEATIAESQRFISSTDPKSDPRMLFSVMKPF